MRGTGHRTGRLFSYLSWEERVSGGRPLADHALMEAALASLLGDFTSTHSIIGQPSILPEKPLSELLLRAFCSVRSGELPVQGW